MNKHKRGVDTEAQAAQRLADEELMHLIRGGDPRAFAVVYDRHCGSAFSLAYRMCGTRAAAEDVVQEAFLSLWRSGGRYDASRGSVRTWLLGITHNRSIDALRRATVHDRRRASDEGLEERFQAPDRTDVEVARREEASEIAGAMAELPDEQSEVIRLAYFGGYTHTEIADILGAPLGTVKGRMRLGLEKLRGQLGGLAGEAGGA
jgi:RNA polymerase sigma-70 factor (ECF subfamily)